jgi:hypothetical protein
MAPYKFDDRTSFNEYDNYVLDWARDGLPGTPAMRVQASAEFVRRATGLQWTNKRAIETWFNQEKLKHLAAVEKAAATEKGEFGVYPIG